MEFEELADWQLDRLLTQYEQDIREKEAYIRTLSMSRKNADAISYARLELHRLRTGKGHIRAEIVRRRPNGIPC